MTPALQGLLEHLCPLEPWLHEGGLSGSESQQVRRHQNLTVTIRAGADANHGNIQFPPQPTGQHHRDVFQHQGKASLLLKIQGFLPDLLLIRGAACLTTPAQAMDGLGRKPQVAHHRDAGPHQPADHRHGFRLGPLQFNRLTWGFLEKTTRRGHRLLRATLIAQERQIRHQQGPMDGSTHCLGVMHHGPQRNGQCCGVPQAHHGQRVPHQGHVTP